MKNLTFLVLLTISANALAEPLEAVEFDLIQLHGSRKNGDCDDHVKLAEGIESVVNTIKDEKFWSKQDDEDGVYVKVTKIPYEEPILPLGTTNKEALYMARDLKNTTVFSKGHEQGDMGNRWAHSYLARIPGEIIKRNGGSEIVASLVGMFFFVPKEFLYDLHPSSGDLVVTYSDRLGTKKSQFQITMFGDSIYKHRPFEDVKLFQESSPFITWKRKL